MHKGVILLVKSDDAEEARECADSFMGEYQNHVWDWYQIGGRWSGILSNYNPRTDPDNFETCPSCGGSGCSRCENGTCLKWPTNWVDHPGNIIPLASCIDVVNEWIESSSDPEALLEQAEEYKNSDQKFMRPYYLHRAADALGQSFSSDTNVFNTESYNFSIPDDVDGWFAVMVDMHN